MGERNREKEEKLFRAMSGVDEELLLRSEQGSGKDTGKVHRFPIRRISRVAAACLCFVVIGALFVTVRNSSKMADSTGAEMAAPQLAYSITADQGAVENESAAAPKDAAGDNTAEAAMPEAAMAQAEAEIPEGEAASPQNTDNAFMVGSALQGNAEDNSSMTEKQGSQMNADTMAEASVSGNEASDAGSSTETVKDQSRYLQRKMTTKGQ